MHDSPPLLKAHTSQFHASLFTFEPTQVGILLGLPNYFLVWVWRVSLSHSIP